MRSRLGARGAAAVAVLVLACLIAALGGGGATAAPRQGPNRAVVIVDSGTGSLVRGIEFSSDSISGIEALQLAGMAPVVWGSPGEGGAVCALRGVGCPADNSCLTCQAPRYWAYHRAPGGSGGFTYSQVGAGSTRVHDGDVEGWKWGTGSAPAYRSFESVYPEPAPPAPGPGPGGSAGTPGGAGFGTPADGASPGSEDEAGVDGGRSTTTTAPGSTTSEPEGQSAGGEGRASAERPADDLETAEAASARQEAENGRGWLASALLFTLVLAVIAALIWRARRQRRA